MTTFYHLPVIDKYTGAHSGIIIVMLSNNTVWHVPPDPANTDYQAYLDWVAEGNTAEEWNPDTD